MQPRGLGMPAILAATLAGPFGKSWYSSLTVTPEVLPRTRTVGLTRVGEESLVVDGHVVAGVGDGGHGGYLPDETGAGLFLPRAGMAGLMPGMSRLGSRPCQYSGWKASLPRWFSRDGRSSGSPTGPG